MHGVHALVDFCKDEFWDVPTRDVGGGVFLELDCHDPRYDPFYHFLCDVRNDTGIRRIEPIHAGLVIHFDECGATNPSMVFLLKSTFKVPGHLRAARVKDRNDQLEVLYAYAATEKPFPKGLTHPAIRLIQRRLIGHGFYVAPNGRWGPKTRLQLWRFRRRHHLPTPGFITEATLFALEV